MTSSLEKKISFAVLSSVALIALLCVFGYRILTQLKTNADWTAHTHEVLISLKHIEASLVDAETGQRGYLLAGDKAYLEPYNGALARVDKQIAGFRQLVADNPYQIDQVARLQPLVEQKLAELQQTIAEYDVNGAAAALAIVARNHGKQLMDDIRLVDDAIEQHEIALLTQRQAAESLSLRHVAWFMSFAIGLYALLLATFCDFIRRELRQRRMMEKALRDSESRVRAIADNIPALITYVDRDERYGFANNFLGALGHKDSQQILGRTMREVCTPALYREITEKIGAVLDGHQVRFEGSAEVAGRIYHHESHYIPDRADDGSVRGFYGMSFDITERKETEEALFRERERLDVTLSSIGDSVITTDADCRVTYLNPIAEAMTGWDCQSASGVRLDQVLRLINYKTREAAPNPLEQAIREKRIVELAADTILVRRDGAEAGIEDSAAPIRDRAGNVIGGVLVFHDVSEARAMVLRMQHQAYHDALTGLPNRTLLKDRLAQAISGAGRHSGKLALLFLDLDKFKQVNDTMGHARGDELLKEVARRLGACVRGSDTVSRLGGDEFVILLPEIDDIQRVAHVADKVRAAVAAPYRINGDEVPIGVSIGIGIYPDDGSDVDTLLKHADAAMYEAKAHGRNNYQFFTPAMNARAVARYNLEVALRRALSNAEFTLHYQPKVNFASGAIIGAEALIRWRQTDGSYCAPADFIPLAEETGLIVPIGLWVMRTACAQNFAWQRAGMIAVPISVNVSVVQLRQNDFFSDVSQILTDTGLDPGLLELEFTESVLMGEEVKFTRLMDSLMQLGVRLSIDDFGTGYSSLSYLKRFPMNTLKIDRSFVRDVTGDANDATITLTIINLARSLGLQVVAEGVETAAQATLLHGQGCTMMQGYHFGRPMPAAEFRLLVPTIRNEQLTDLVRPSSKREQPQQAH